MVIVPGTHARGCLQPDTPHAVCPVSFSPLRHAWWLTLPVPEKWYIDQRWPVSVTMGRYSYALMTEETAYGTAIWHLRREHREPSFESMAMVHFIHCREDRCGPGGERCGCVCHIWGQPADLSKLAVRDRLLEPVLRHRLKQEIEQMFSASPGKAMVLPPSEHDRFHTGPGEQVGCKCANNDRAVPVAVWHSGFMGSFSTVILWRNPVTLEVRTQKIDGKFTLEQVNGTDH